MDLSFPASKSAAHRSLDVLYGFMYVAVFALLINFLMNNLVLVLNLRSCGSFFITSEMLSYISEMGILIRPGSNIQSFRDSTLSSSGHLMNVYKKFIKIGLYPFRC